MKIEVFAKLNASGDLDQTDHIFTGKPKDLENIGVWLEEAYELNRRKKSVEALSLVFRDQDTPYVRLSKKQSGDMHEALTSLSEVKRSKPLRQLVKSFDTSLCVY